MDAVALGVAKSFAKRLGRPRLLPVATRDISQYAGFSNGTDTSETSRSLHVAATTCAGVRLVYANVQGNNGANPQGQFDGANAITVRACVEVGSTFYPVYFNGSLSVTIDPGGVVVSDHCGAALTAGTSYFVRTYVSVASVGQKWQTGLVTASGNGEGKTVGSDLTPNGSAAVTAVSTGIFSPWAVLGEATSPPAPGVVMCGDSILNGSHDTANLPDSPNMGHVERALNKTIGFIKISQPGETAQNFAASALRRHREQMFLYATDVVCNYGRNDVTQGRTLAQIQADLITVWTAASRRRPRIWHTTITPVTSSTDSWATTGNQTTTSNEAVRLTLNAWLRDGAPMSAGAAVATGTVGASRCAVYSGAGALVTAASGAAHMLSGVFDPADTIETARNSGIWKATGSAQGYCFDGTHPSAGGYALMAAAIPVAKFTG